MTDQSEVGSVGNYLDIIKEACSITCEPDSHSNWILNEIKHQIKENAKSNDERKFYILLERYTAPHLTTYHTIIFTRAQEAAVFWRLWVKMYIYLYIHTLSAICFIYF